MSAGRERAQATVETALVLPLVVLMVLVVLQVVVVLRDAVALTAAARAAARRAMVDPSTDAVRSAALSETRLLPDRLAVTVSGSTAPGALVTVVVRYRSPTDVPVVGAFVGDVELAERYTALRE